MADDTPTAPTPPSDVTSPKGGLYGAAFSAAGLPSDVRAVMAQQRWVTTLGGNTPPPTMTYSFPTSAADYTDVVGYPETASLVGFSPLSDNQEAAVRTAFAMV